MHTQRVVCGAHEAALHVAIDGPAGAGKSTVGRALARALDCPYVDTGLMYRAVTWLALDRGVSLADSAALEHLAGEIHFCLEGHDVLLVNGRPAGSALRTPTVDAAVSVVSAYPGVREQMVRRQREIAAGRCVVMVGRDIGTVVLQDASVKLWVTASAAERARRRLEERLPGSSQVSAAEMVHRIMERDALDSGRAISPLRRAAGAIEIETDNLSPEQALGRAMEAVARMLDTLESRGDEVRC